MEAIIGMVILSLAAVAAAVWVGILFGGAREKASDAEAERDAAQDARSEYDRASVEFDNRRPLE